MNFHILTLFPEMVENGLKTSIIGRAVAGGLLSIEAVNIRDFAFLHSVSAFGSVPRYLYMPNTQAQPASAFPLLLHTDNHLHFDAC